MLSARYVDSDTATTPVGRERGEGGGISFYGKISIFPQVEHPQEESINELLAEKVLKIRNLLNMCMYRQV